MTEIIEKLLQKIALTGNKLISLAVDNEVRLAVIQRCDGSEQVVEYINGEWVA